MHRLAPRILASLTVAALAASLGCQQLKSAVLGASTGARTTTNAMFTKKINDAPLEVDVRGPIAVHVDSFGGDVIVEVDETLSHAVVTLTRFATHGSGRKEEAIASFETISSLIEVRQGSLGQELFVRTMTTHDEPWFQEVRVEIAVPEVDGLIVNTEVGDVKAVDIYGVIDIHTGQGNVQLLTMRPLVRPVTVITDAGSINYRVRGESTAAFDTHAVHGRVSHTIDYGTFLIGDGRTSGRMMATHNDGHNPVVLRAAQGDIKISVVDAPTYVGHWLLD